MAERTYTVPLRSGFRNAPKYKRSNKAMRTLKAFVAKHMKVDIENVRIGQHLNDRIWENGIRNPPPRVTINVKTEDGKAFAELEDKKYTDVKAPLGLEEEPTGLKEKIQAAVGKKPGEDSEEVEDAKQEDKDPKPPVKEDKAPGKQDKKPAEEAKKV